MEDRASAMVSKKNDINFILDKLFVLDDKKTKRVQDNINYVKNEILTIHNNKDDLGNFRNTAWGIYNAVADYSSNSEPLRKTDTFETKRFVSCMDGNDLLVKTQKLLGF